MTKIQTDINAVENEEERMNQPKSGLFEKINKIHKFLLRFNEAEREKSPRNNRRNLLNDVSKNRTGVKKVTQEYYGKLNWTKLGSFQKGKMNSIFKILFTFLLSPSFTQIDSEQLKSH